MNGIKYLIDTCTLIGLQKQTPESIALLNQSGALLEECAISVITYIEFVGFHGVDTATGAQLVRIADAFTCLPINTAVTLKTIQIRKAHKLKLPDALILASAKVNGLELLTLDEKLKRIEPIT